MTDNASGKGKSAATGSSPRWVRRAVIIGACALVIGVYAWCAKPGPTELLGSGAQGSYYNLLVQGFRAGQLNLTTEVPSALAQLANPYDPEASGPYRWMYGNPLHDLSYYKGKLYLYFGITPALLLFWPYAALTGHYLLHKDAVVIFFSVGFLASVGLLCAVWRRYFKETGVGMVVAGTFALGVANFVPAILARSDVWEVAISCGSALTMLALAGIWRALHEVRRQGRWLAAASLAYALAVGARPSLLFGAVILLIPVAQAWREKRRTWPLLLAATGPVVLMGMGLMLYNDMRFDNPLEFGQHYQLPQSQPKGTHEFGLRYFWFNFQVGFLDPAHWNLHFPFVHDITTPPLLKGVIESQHPFGLLTNIPLVWLALAVPLAWRNRPAPGRSTLRWFLESVTLLFGICALGLLFHNSMCIRYEVEFAQVLVLLAVIGMFGLERALASQPAWRRAARCGWGLLLTVSVAFNLFASFELQAKEEAHRNFADAFLDKGKVDEAIIEYQKALEITPNNADVHLSLGYTLLQKRELDEALVQYQKALEINPDLAEAHYNLGRIFEQQRRLDEAIAHYQKTVELKPDHEAAQLNLGSCLCQQGRLREAIPHYQKALEIEPNDAAVRYNLGASYFKLGRTDEAIAQLQKAAAIKPGDAVMLGTLAAAYAEVGRFSEAMETAQRALRLAEEQSNTRLAGQIQAQLKSYQAGMPFHNPAQTH